MTMEHLLASATPLQTNIGITNVYGNVSFVEIRTSLWDLLRSIYKRYKKNILKRWREHKDPIEFSLSFSTFRNIPGS